MIHNCQGETETIQSPFTDVDVTATYGQTELSYFLFALLGTGTEPGSHAHEAGTHLTSELYPQAMHEHGEQYGEQVVHSCTWQLPAYA